MLKQNPTLLLSLLSLFSVSTAFGWGIGLDPVALPINASCSVTVLRGTETGKFKGVAFVAPTVLISVDKYGDRLFDIIPGKNGKWILRVGFYIPSDPVETMKYRIKDNSTLIGAQTCTMDTIKAALAMKVKMQKGQALTEKLDANSQSQINTLSMLPVSAMDVKITSGSTDDKDAVELKTTVGKGSSIRNSAGTDWIAEFTMDGDDKEVIMSKLRDRIGLQFEVNMHFNAQSQTGATNISVSSKKMADEIKAGLSGKGDLKKIAVSGDIKTDISRIINKVAIQATIEGSSPDLASFTKDVMDKVTSALATDPSAQIQSPATPTADAATGNSISVYAFYTKLSKEDNFSLNMKTVSGDQDSIASSNVIIQATEDASGFSVASNQAPRVLPIALKANDTFTFNVAKYEYKQFSGRMSTPPNGRNILTRDELQQNFEMLMSAREHGLHPTEPGKKAANCFPELAKLGGARLASCAFSGKGHETASPSDLAEYNQSGSWGGETHFVWESVDVEPVYFPWVSPVRSNNICKGEPLKFRFGNYSGRWFTVPELVAAASDPVWNKVFTATCDQTGLTIHAKKALGRIAAYNWYQESVERTNRYTRFWLETEYSGNSKTGDFKSQSVVKDRLIGIPKWVTSYRVDLRAAEVGESFQQISTTFKSGDRFLVDFP